MRDVAREGKPIVANVRAAVGRCDRFTSDQLIRRFVIANGVVAWRGEMFAKRCSYYCPQGVSVPASYRERIGNKAAKHSIPLQKVRCRQSRGAVKEYLVAASAGKYR
jgi:hypothetical protein